MRAVWQPETVTRRMNEISSTALLWGFDALELRSVGGPEDRVPHVSERLIRTSCLEADLEVAALDPEFFTGPTAEKANWMNELAVLPEVIRLAGRLRCPGIILGSLEDGGEADESSVAAALERILGDAGRLARREGIALHIRTASDRRAQIVRDVVASTGHKAVSLLPEFGVELKTDGDDPVVAVTGADPPQQNPDTSYVRLIYDGPESISIDETEILQENLRQFIARLAASGFSSDVCLEFRHRPEPATGLRVSTAFVSAINQG